MRNSVKKAVSALIAAVMSLSMIAAVSAENNPEVYVDKSLVVFPDQEAVIVGEGTTLVPARGVFNAMGADVQWDEEKRRVRIDSSDNITRIYITIDNPVMEIYTFTSVLEAVKSELTLEGDSVPRIINDRTMIPLRAISETLKADVQWDEDTYSVNITTKEAAAVNEATLPSLSLTTDAESVKEGDTVNVYIKADGLPFENKHLSTISAIVNYDKEAFEYQDTTLYSDGEDKEATINTTNPDYSDDGLKFAIVTISPDVTSNGEIVKLTFKALSDKGGEFSLGNTYEIIRGHSTELTLSSTDDSVAKTDSFSGINLNVVTEPITINGAAE